MHILGDSRLRNKKETQFFNVCSKTHLTKNQHHTEISQSIWTAYQFTGLYARRALTERCF